EMEQGIDKFRKVTSERLATLRLQSDLVAIAKGETAKAIPLWFVLPIGAGWKLLDGFCFHWGVRVFQRQSHRILVLPSPSGRRAGDEGLADTAHLNPHPNPLPTGEEDMPQSCLTSNMARVEIASAPKPAASISRPT